MCWSESLLKNAYLGGSLGSAKCSQVSMYSYRYTPLRNRSSRLSLMGSYWPVILKASALLAATSLSRDASRNWALSMKRSSPRDKEMHFSVLLGIQEMRPTTFEIACISKCESYTRKLWKTTGMAVVLGFSRSLRLQALWAVPGTSQ